MTGNQSGARREISLAGTPAATPLGYVSWAVFEWARNPYVILVTIYVFAPYFASTVVEDPVRGQSLLGYANSIAGIIIALCAPFLGAIADKNPARKPWLIAFVLIVVPCVSLLWFAKPGGGGIGIYPALGLIIIASVMLEFSGVFHNAMLPSTAPANRVGLVSGLALGLGNIGGLILMVGTLYAFVLPGTVDWSFLPDTALLGLNQADYEHTRIIPPLTALWWLVFALPLFFFTPDGVSSGLRIGAAERAGLRDVLTTVRSLRHYSNIAWYLIARMLFNDGLVGILIFGGVFAAGTFGWDSSTMLIFGIITSLSAAFGGFIGGWVDDWLGSKRTILFSIGATSLLLVSAVSLQPDVVFFMPHDSTETLWSFPYFNTLPEFLYLLNNQLFGIFITIGFASARTMMARISPPEKITQFFGLYALSGTATAFLAPLTVATVTTVFASQRAGFLSLILLLGAGWVMMFWIREEQAKVAA